MEPHRYRPVANGLRTDHPIPDLPFVDDSHIPIDDRVLVEAIGRGRHDGMWGREDRCPDGGWVAFTTDPRRTDLAWIVRWHPEHGRSVVVYTDDDVSSAYMTYWGSSLLFRAGGYWWDGTTWYRPAQIWDQAREVYVRRSVLAAMTVTAQALLGPGHGEVARAAILAVEQLQAGVPTQGKWIDQLALWASRRGDGLPLSACIVSLNAPELAADQMIGIAELAELGGLGASTLRAYLAREQNDVPAPQALVGRNRMWARPVGEEWAEARRNSASGAAETMAETRDGSSLPVGVNALWQHFTRLFTTDLWTRPHIRKRWALRYRTQDSVERVAEDLGWTVAASLDRIVPIHALGTTLTHAILDELAHGKTTIGVTAFYGIAPQISKLLGWLIRHDPTTANHTVTQAAGDAERRMNIPLATTKNSIATGLSLSGEFTDNSYLEFLDRALPTPDSP